MRITLRQTSPESESIYDFIIELYKVSNGDWKSLQAKANISDEELKYFLEYAAMFLGNSGNYKSFGDSKFVPRGDEKSFDALATVSPKVKEFYKATKGAIFSSGNSGIMHLGYPEQGHLSTYYPDSEGITKAEIGAVSDFLEKKGLLVVSCNTPLFWTFRNLTLSDSFLRKTLGLGKIPMVALTC
jgi:dipeptidyl-peptidase-3